MVMDVDEIFLSLATSQRSGINREIGEDFHLNVVV